MTALRAVDGWRILTEREQRVLTRIAEGAEVREMARDFGLSERTIKAIVSVVLTKLGARNRAHAVALAIQEGYLLTGDRALIIAKHEVDLLRQERDELRAKLERVRRIIL